MRSCSSSTASMKVKNVKKWVDTQTCTNTHTHTPASACLLHLSHIPPSLCSSLFIALTDCLSPLFPAWVPSIPSVYFCVFLLLSLPLFALCSLLLILATHTNSEVLSWAEDEVSTKLCVCVIFFRLCFTKGHFPKLAECAHFHYENVDFGTIQVDTLNLFFPILMPNLLTYIPVMGLGLDWSPSEEYVCFNLVVLNVWWNCLYKITAPWMSIMVQMKLWTSIFFQRLMFFPVIPLQCWVRNGNMMFIKTQVWLTCLFHLTSRRIHPFRCWYHGTGCWFAFVWYLFEYPIQHDLIHSSFTHLRGFLWRTG